MYQGNDAIKCDLCGNSLRVPPGERASIVAGMKGWEWFTGNRRTTFHACPECRTTRHDEIRAAMMAAGIKS